MRLADLHPDLRGVFRFVPPIPLRYGWFRRACNWTLARLPARTSIGNVRVSEHALSNARVRVYRTATQSSGAALLWVHGGGMVIGSARMDDGLCARYARDLQLLVVAVDYRLAPEQPFPAALDDCFEAWQWLVGDAARLGIDASRIAISGQSAGGGLSATLAQRVLDHGGVQPAGVALLCPMLDDRPAARHELDALADRVWTNDNNRAGWSAYLSQPPGLPSVPPYAVAARRENLVGLPPTWIAVSGLDLLCDEGKAYHQRLLEGGVASELYVTAGAPHGFEAFAPRTRLARDLFRANYDFLQRRLSLPIPAADPYDSKEAP